MIPLPVVLALMAIYLPLAPASMAIPPLGDAEGNKEVSDFEVVEYRKKDRLSSIKYFCKNKILIIFILLQKVLFFENFLFF